MHLIVENQHTFDHLMVVGDTHGNNTQLAHHLLPNLPKEDKKAILHVGDFGIGFSTIRGDFDMMTHLNMKLKKANVFLYAIRGNHDDPEYFDISNDKYHSLTHLSNIVLVPDHSLLALGFTPVSDDGKSLRIVKRIYCYGGAVSVDRCLRTVGKSYWGGEMVKEPTTKMLEEIPSDIDIILTHTRPEGVFPVSKDGIKGWMERDMALENDLNIELSRITRVFNVISIKNPQEMKHFYGHFHTSNSEHINNIKHQLLNIDELIEIRL